MEFKSSFIDNLRLLLKGKYIVSDKDLMTLSDTIIKNGLKDIAEKGLLIALFYCLDANNVTFPISYNYFKSLWEKEHTTINFDKILKELKKNNLISLRKVSSATYFNAPNISRDIKDKPIGDKYLVFYGTKLYNEFKNTAIKLLNVNVSRISTVSVLEGVNVSKLDGKFKKFINTTTKNMKDYLDTKFYFESYDYDSFTNEMDFNFIITIPDIKKFKLPSHAIKRIMKKNIKGSGLLEVDSYADGDNEVFLALKMDIRTLEIDLKNISDGIIFGTEEIMDNI